MLKQTQLNEQISKLQDFIEFTYVAFFKTLKKFDKRTGGSELTKYMRRVEESSFFSGGVNLRSEDDSQSSLKLLENSEYSNVLWEQLGDAALLSAHALKDVSIDNSQSGRACQLTQNRLLTTFSQLKTALKGTKGKANLVKETTRFKARIFRSFIADVMKAVDLTNPDTAAALEKLYFAHQTLFLAEDEVDLSLRVAANPLESVKDETKLPSEKSAMKTSNDEQFSDWYLVNSHDDKDLSIKSSSNQLPWKRKNIFKGRSESKLDYNDAENDSDREHKSWSTTGIRRRLVDNSDKNIEEDSDNHQDPLLSGGERKPMHIQNLLDSSWGAILQSSPTSKERKDWFGTLNSPFENDDEDDEDSKVGKDCDCTCRGIKQYIWTLLPPRPSICIWLPNYNWQEHLLADIISGITISVMVIPQGLAYAGLVGIDPIYGVYAGMVPAIAYTIYGTSREGAVGPMSVPSLMMGAFADTKLGENATEEERVNFVLSLTMLSALLIFLSGVFRLGNMIHFISRPVLAGFVSASGILAASSMLKKVLAPDAKTKKKDLFTLITAMAGNIDSAKPLVVGLLVVGILCILGLKALKGIVAIDSNIRVTNDKNASKKSLKVRAKKCCDKFMHYFPPTIIIVVGAVLFGFILCGFELPEEIDGDRECASVPIVGSIPADLSVFLPKIPNAMEQFSMLPDAGMLAIVVLLEHMSNVKLYAKKNRYESDGDKELLAVGTANIFGSMFSSFLVGAGFSRSAVNEASGAKSQMSLFISGFVVAGFMLVMGPILAFLPKPILSCIVIVAVVKLIDIKTAKRLWFLKKLDFVIMMTAFLGVLFLGVVEGMIGAVTLSLLVFIYYATQPRIIELGRAVGTLHYTTGEGVRFIDKARVLRFEAPLFFANAGALNRRIRRELATDGSASDVALVLDFSAVGWVDSTAADTLIDTLNECAMYGTPVCIAAMNKRSEKIMEKAGLHDEFGEEFLFTTVHLAVRAIEQGHVANAFAEKSKKEGNIGKKKELPSELSSSSEAKDSELEA
eukprot:g5295.t1